MTILLLVWALLTVLEILLWSPLLWRPRKLIAGVIVLPMGVLCGLLVAFAWSWWTALFIVLTGYRIVNVLRVVEGRTHADYLRRVARHSSWLLLVAQALCLLIIDRWNHDSLPSHVAVYAILVGQLLLAMTVVYATVRHMRTTRPAAPEKAYADRDLPSITVAIPARNETEDLEACLRSLIASDYPKMEILVLDDCSQERRTPEIIRGFAHDGVRFLSGEVPPDHWLAKNFAYEQLAHEANGDLLLFCGVDARFSIGTVRDIVTTLLTKKKSMLSVMPLNTAPSSFAIEKFLAQPSRYAWELSLPRRWFNRPPVLSTCWLITKELLHAAGGFEAVSQSIRPESYLASKAIKDDGYSFLRSDANIGLSCDKSALEQRDTAIRTRYPQLHRRPELAAILSLIELGGLVLPYILLILALVRGQALLAGLEALCVILLTIFYVLVVRLAYHRFYLRSIWLLPCAAVYDVVVMNYSMWAYEFREVIWKSRNVCVPVMRTIPRLPKF